jgi:integrase/recombinase XerD
MLLNTDGNPLNMRAWAHYFRGYARQGGLRARGLHSLRHAYATHLLEGGARLEDLKHLLGHASITTTQIYAQVTVRELIREVRRTHPRARRRNPQ